MLHLPAGFSISVLLRITTDGTPNSKDNLEARDNKTGPECKKQGCCRCEGKRVFSAGRKKKTNYGGADGRGGYSGLLKTSQDLTVFVSLKTHTTGFTEEGQIN